jgi:hypothetical protein
MSQENTTQLSHSLSPTTNTHHYHHRSHINSPYYPTSRYTHSSSNSWDYSLSFSFIFQDVATAKNKADTRSAELLYPLTTLSSHFSHHKPSTLHHFYLPTNNHHYHSHSNSPHQPIPTSLATLPAHR